MGAPVLQAGSKAPDFKLPACTNTLVSIQDYASKRVVLLFLPKQVHEELRAQLTRYQENAATFEGLNSTIVAVAEMSLEQLPQLSADRHVHFPLLSDLQRDV